MTKILTIPSTEYSSTVIGEVCDPIPDPSAILQLNSTTQGFVGPRLTTVQVNEIVSPAVGLLVFNTDLAEYVFWNGSAWTPIGSGGTPSPTPTPGPTPAPTPAPTPSAEAGVFILGASPTGSGIVGSQTYKPNTVPSNIDLATATTDTSPVIINIGANGGYLNYNPVITVNGITATLTETSTKRWFTGTAQITLVSGANTVIATSSEGGTDTAIITLSAGGPAVQSVAFGSYPGSQTELKSGDVIGVTIDTDMSATSVTVQSGGATSTTFSFPVTNGVATGNITIGSNSGSQPITVKAQNSLGTFGTVFTSGNLTLDQVHPTIGSFTVTYPSTQTAFGAGQGGTIASTVTNFDTITYSSANFTIGGGTTTYQATKAITEASGTYVYSGTNYTITAVKASNNSTTTASTLAKIASVAPTAAITISPTGRLVSSPTGILYTITLTPTQVLPAAPSMNASLGMFQGSWTPSGNNWTIGLLISDSTAKGTGVFTSLSMTNGANIVGTSITSGSTYTVGGFAVRTLTFAAFSRVSAIGTNVATAANLQAAIVGGNTLTLEPDNGVYSDGFYPANSDGSYNATGAYMGLSDTAFVGSNTSGTLQCTIQETA
jgi:hypothetical protein